ncbi:bifunctional 5,10-methylenetetrahydrofolate dehydrogenase/5,10-methenyltetrahydrofolate cyclohydrolase [Candidatus Saccharibacteria bacterium]|nr:bifunctional 5,10-methylenetetrahydrofolate dehydrogenase/5,10-methenyltetrahydrofolate cyclohydrolase [Candidatus Saccharibacteria bacterium]
MLLLTKTIVEQIKQDQILQVQELARQPKLIVLVANQDPVIESYLKIKAGYGQEIGVDVKVERVSFDQLEQKIQYYNQIDCDGIVVQLPIDFVNNPDQTDYLLSLVSPAKDIDGLSGGSKFVPPTVRAINQLLEFSEIILGSRIHSVTIVGQGRLVGAPLARFLENKGVGLRIVSHHDNLDQVVKQSSVLVSAVGNPELIGSRLIQPGTIVIDAGTSDDQGAIYGDVDSDALDRDDIYITPPKGGVGPLTVAMLFDNLLKSVEAAESA